MAETFGCGRRFLSLRFTFTVSVALWCAKFGSTLDDMTIDRNMRPATIVMFCVPPLRCHLVQQSRRRSLVSWFALRCLLDVRLYYNITVSGVTADQLLHLRFHCVSEPRIVACYSYRWLKNPLWRVLNPLQPYCIAICNSTTQSKRGPPSFNISLASLPERKNDGIVDGQLTASALDAAVCVGLVFCYSYR
ncbi:hypothetical protein FOCC_FOCC006214 [Frankliniella occidentalis]|nr:hypothetical protein FOCC_FOCC006214 [Frankliniella occidentalis]